MNKYLILDCYVDEPACFGVPPFISPYPRYVFGALLDAGIEEKDITYCTIDAVRNDDFIIDRSYSMVFLIGGAVVPGKYLGYKIGTYQEICRIIKSNSRIPFAAGGLSGRLLSTESFTNAIPLTHDIEQFAFLHAKGEPADALRNYSDLDRWSVLGASVIRRHFEYPDLIAEIETYRGCPRESHCSFCSEHIFRDIIFRSPQSVLSEVDALIESGISRFRIGRQADILAYGSAMDCYKKGFPQPNPSAVKELFSGLQTRREAGLIRTLNIDNANPGTIANFPEESSLALASIVAALTPGDTLPLGVESFDPEVYRRNNLKVNTEECMQAVRIINEIGGIRRGGIPVLLPGINLIHGLPGETKETFRINFEALCAMKNEGLLLKRINIRTLSPFPGTAAAEQAPSMKGGIVNRYDYYRDKIREDIDHDMLKKIYPAGTVLTDLRIVDTMFDYSYARPLQSYAITLKMPVPLEKKSTVDCVITGHRERSLAALPLPLDINTLPAKALESIPGVSKKCASDIILARPLKDAQQLLCIAPSFSSDILPHCTW